MEKIPFSGVDQKISEYVKRIRAGESKESIIAGLPPSFVAGIDKMLAQPEEAGARINPPINYIEVSIDDEYMSKNLFPNGALLMQGGQANWDNEVDIIKYEIDDNLSPQYRQIAAEKIAKHEAREETTYQHESQHISNRENDLAPHIAAETLREFLAFRVLDEISAFSRGELYNQEMTADNILKALKLAEQSILQSYYGKPFEGDADWYMSQYGGKAEALSREINPDKYRQVMTQYFNIGENDILSTLQTENKMPEFTEIVNSLILKLDSLLAARNPES